MRHFVRYSKDSSNAEFLLLLVLLFFLGTYGVVFLYWATEVDPIFIETRPAVAKDVAYYESSLSVERWYKKTRNCPGNVIVYADDIKRNTRYTLQSIAVGWKETDSKEKHVTVKYPLVDGMEPGEYDLVAVLDYNCNPLGNPPSQELRVRFKRHGTEYNTSGD